MTVENPRTGKRVTFVSETPEIEAGPGVVVAVPPGVAHLAWNPTKAPVRLRIEMRPALRWREFTTRFFAGESPAALLAEFAAEVRLP
jgi:oxalate decarboxylase/phosphoglucose isomerase-like protein (cupin superfamily)